MTDRLIERDPLARFSAALFEAVGVPPDDALFAAGTLVEADLRGVYSHGTVRLQPKYLQELASGKINPTPAISVAREGPGFAVVDGDGGMGQLVSRTAMGLAVDKARSNAVGAVVARRSRHYGAAAFWSMMAAHQGMIGFTCSNGPGVNTAPYGGIEPSQGNLPLSWAVPADREFPILLDMATGVVAFGKIAMAQIRSESIPSGWAIDEEGNDVTDPGKAAAVLPAGGPKGYGLGVILDSLAGSLSGGMPSIVRLDEGTDDRSADASNHFFLAIDVRQFIPLDEFEKTVDSHVRLLRGIRPREGFDRVYAPGEIEWLTKEKRLTGGIPFRPEELAVLEKMGRDYGVLALWN